MKITKSEIGAGLILTAAAAGMYGSRCYLDDHKQVEKIKQELRKEVKEHSSFPSEMDIEIAEINEPFFDRLNYWQVTADSIRKEIKKESL